MDHEEGIDDDGGDMKELREHHISLGMMVMFREHTMYVHARGIHHEVLLIQLLPPQSVTYHPPPGGLAEHCGL